MTPLFRFDLNKARTDIGDPNGSIWPVNAYSDADELNSLLEAAQDTGLIARHQPAKILIYPLSLSEPDPLVAVAPPAGPTLLGFGLKLREQDGESPLEFTLRLLGHTVEAANSLVGEAVNTALPR